MRIPTKPSLSARAVVTLASVVATMVVACADSGGHESSSAIERDSAGIRIVENIRARLGSEAWTIVSRPTLEVGRGTADTAATFTRINSAFRMRDGSIAVADGEANTIRIVDSLGVPRLSIGRAGQGPGEFEGLGLVFPAPDNSILTSDMTGRITQFRSAGGGYAASVLTMEPASLAGVFDDGGMVLIPGSGFRAINPPEGITRWIDSSTLVIADRTGKRVADPLRVAAIELNYPTGFVGYSPRGVWSVGPRLLFQAYPSDYSVRAYRPDGKPALIIRRRVEPSSVGKADVDRLIEKALARFDKDTPPQIVEGTKRMTVSENFPAFKSIIADRSGNVWVQEYRKESDIPALRAELDRESLRWSVFSENGHWITDVLVPAGLRLLEVGETYVIGTTTTDSDVPVIRVHALRKGS